MGDCIMVDEVEHELLLEDSTKSERFFKLVESMRAHQKSWFKHKLKGDLIKARTLESEVDAIIRARAEPELEF